MSWLGGRLSQFSSLTDQISSFTKEVLTETTEEVEGTISRIAKLPTKTILINTPLTLPIILIIKVPMVCCTIEYSAMFPDKPTPARPNHHWLRGSYGVLHKVTEGVSGQQGITGHSPSFRSLGAVFANNCTALESSKVGMHVHLS